MTLQNPWAGISDARCSIQTDLSVLCLHIKSRILACGLVNWSCIAGWVWSDCWGNYYHMKAVLLLWISITIRLEQETTRTTGLALRYLARLQTLTLHWKSSLAWKYNDFLCFQKNKVRREVHWSSKAPNVRSPEIVCLPFMFVRILEFLSCDPARSQILIILSLCFKGVFIHLLSHR